MLRFRHLQNTIRGTRNDMLESLQRSRWRKGARPVLNRADGKHPVWQISDILQLTALSVSSHSP